MQTHRMLVFSCTPVQWHIENFRKAAAVYISLSMTVNMAFRF